MKLHPNVVPYLVLRLPQTAAGMGHAWPDWKVLSLLDSCAWCRTECPQPAHPYNRQGSDIRNLC